MTSQNTAIWKHSAHNISTKLTLWSVSSFLYIVNGNISIVSPLSFVCLIDIQYNTCFVCLTFFFLWYLTFCHWVKYFKLYHNVIVSPKYIVPNVVYVCMRGSRIFFSKAGPKEWFGCQWRGVYIQFLWLPFNLQRTVLRCIMSCQ